MQEADMRLRTYRDTTYAWHLDLIGDAWSVDLVYVSAAILLVSGFVCAVLSHL
jgi:hypothetical protein